MLGWKKPPWEKKIKQTIEKMPFEGGHFELHKNAVYFRPPPKSLPNGNLNRNHHFGYVHVWKLVL